jgi:excisionase family DNA binding protein
MNKTEAAEFLNVSTRALERYVAAGRVASFYERGKTGKVLAFDADELERFKTELEAPTSRAIALPDKAPTQPTSRALAKPDGAANAFNADALVVLAQLISDSVRQAAPVVPIDAKLLLSLAEAQALTGLSRNTLRAAIDAGKLKAKRIGRGWKVKRRDLDSWIEKL